MSKSKNSFLKFSTLEKANEGIRVVLKDADDRPTDEWVHILGNDSDAFQRASKGMRSRIMRYLEANGTNARETDGYTDLIMEEQRKLQACLVKAWSFGEDCTLENVLEMFKHAPYLADQIEAEAGKRSQFVKS